MVLLMESGQSCLQIGKQRSSDNRRRVIGESPCCELAKYAETVVKVGERTFAVAGSKVSSAGYVYI